MLIGWVLALTLGYVSAWSYPESVANGWDGTCETGTLQSPIDLSTSMTASIHAPLKYKHYFTKDKKRNRKYAGLLVNEGTSVSWYVNPWSKSRMRGGKKWKWSTPNIRDGPFGGDVFSHAYFLWKLEFHWGQPGNEKKGSEHTINGKGYPLELHMIHIEDEYVSTVQKGKIDFEQAFNNSQQTGVAILSVLFKIDHRKPQNQQPLKTVDNAVSKYFFGKRSSDLTEEELESMDEDEIAEMDHAINMRALQYGFEQLRDGGDSSVEKRKTQKQIRLTLAPGAFISKAINKGIANRIATYWTYKGSLTYPDCNEAVTWVVFRRSLPIAQVQANAFGHLYQNNYRKPRAATVDHQVQYLLHKK